MLRVTPVGGLANGSSEGPPPIQQASSLNPVMLDRARTKHVVDVLPCSTMGHDEDITTTAYDRVVEDDQQPLVAQFKRWRAGHHSPSVVDQDGIQLSVEMQPTLLLFSSFLSACFVGAMYAKDPSASILALVAWLVAWAAVFLASLRFQRGRKSPGSLLTRSFIQVWNEVPPASLIISRTSCS